MNKLFLTAVIGFLFLVPLACKKVYTLGPLPPATSTPTPSPTPTCGFILYGFGWGIGILTPVPTDTPTVTPTWNSSLPTPTATSTPTLSLPTPTPVITYPNTAFTGTIIHNLADWTALYGTAAPPAGVNFNIQMLLVMSFPGCCYGSGGFGDVCLTTARLEVKLSYYPTSGPMHCGAICLIPQLIVVPQTNLPVVVTEIDTYY